MKGNGVATLTISANYCTRKKQKCKTHKFNCNVFVVVKVFPYNTVRKPVQ